ncbi:MAG: hypothetical protein IJX17_02660 [Clostridia bacterium]|nr:hypothetical protein [Clostridia bacterium]
MSFKDEMKKIVAVKAKSEKEIKRENLEKAYKVLDEFLEKEFPLYEEYLLSLIKKEIEKNLKAGKFNLQKTRHGDFKVVKGEIFFCSDKYQDDARYAKPIYSPQIETRHLLDAEHARQLYINCAGVNCDYKGVGLNIGSSSFVSKIISIVNVNKDSYYGKILREYFKKIKKEEEIEIDFKTIMKRNLGEDERYSIMKLNYKFKV